MTENIVIIDKVETEIIDQDLKEIITTIDITETGAVVIEIETGIIIVLEIRDLEVRKYCIFIIKYFFWHILKISFVKQLNRTAVRLETGYEAVIKAQELKGFV